MSHVTWPRTTPLSGTICRP